MNETQLILWDALIPLHDEINNLRRTVPSTQRADSLERLNKVKDLIGQAWEKSSDAPTTSRLQEERNI